MTTSETPASCTECNSTLQPYVDGELADSEHRAFAVHLENCRECRVAVSEQQKVRAALRALVPELAPTGLRERILEDLDAIDAESVAPPTLPWRDRFGAFFRGGLVFAPAAAVAAMLFVGVQQGAFDEPVDSDMTSALMPASPSVEAAKPGQLAAAFAADAGKTFEIQVPSARSLPRDVELVGASGAGPADVYHARVEYADRSGDVRFVDHQRRGGQLRPPATHRVFRGRHLYYLARDARGRAFLEFTVDGVHHRLNLHRSETVPGDRSLDLSAADFRALVGLADSLGHARGRD
ncbi:MAG: hypothetical protein B7733_21295 [Myxococcales bacterium FL481]|nr:MAG: hypothetical protein B7733_21295 [Myxococcales bacterium FL481]